MEEDWRGHAVQGVRTGGKGQSQRGEGRAANLEPAGSQMRELDLRGPGELDIEGCYQTHLRKQKRALGQEGSPL